MLFSKADLPEFTVKLQLLELQQEVPCRRGLSTEVPVLLVYGSLAQRYDKVVLFFKVFFNGDLSKFYYLFDLVCFIKVHLNSDTSFIGRRIPILVLNSILP